MVLYRTENDSLTGAWPQYICSPALPKSRSLYLRTHAGVYAGVMRCKRACRRATYCRRVVLHPPSAAGQVNERTHRCISWTGRSTEQKRRRRENNHMDGVTSALQVTDRHSFLEPHLFLQGCCGELTKVSQVAWSSRAAGGKQTRRRLGFHSPGQGISIPSAAAVAHGMEMRGDE